MNYNEIEVFDIFTKLTYDEHFVMSPSEMRAYIKHKTDNFDLTIFKMFKDEINLLTGTIKFTPPKQITGNENQEIMILIFFQEYIWRTANNAEIEKYAQLFPKLDARTKIVEIQSHFKEYDFGLLNQYWQIVSFSDMIIRIYNELQTKQPKPIGTPPPKQPLTFTGLFISPYSENIDLLLEQLRTIGLTKTKDNWREWQTGKVEKNETSKFYYYLKQKNVLNDYDDTPALICFNEIFGIEVYKDKETPKTERFVCIRALISSKKTATKMNLKDKFDIVFIKWIEKIELK